jgi:hypothetical protein
MTTNGSSGSHEQLELSYERLAAAIDQAGSKQELLFLTKLALTLAHRIGEPDIVAECIAVALKDLPQEPGAAGEVR